MFPVEDRPHAQDISLPPLLHLKYNRESEVTGIWPSWQIFWGHSNSIVRTQQDNTHDDVRPLSLSLSFSLSLSLSLSLLFPCNALSKVRNLRFWVQKTASASRFIERESWMYDLISLILSLTECARGRIVNCWSLDLFSIFFPYPAQT